MFDKDGNNVITEDELRQVFHSEKQEALWHEIIKEVDKNSDG